MRLAAMATFRTLASQLHAGCRWRAAALSKPCLAAVVHCSFSGSAVSTKSLVGEKGVQATIRAAQVPHTVEQHRVMIEAVVSR